MALQARVFTLCGPTQGSPPCSFSLSPVGVVPLVTKLVSSLECLSSEVVKCSISSRRIGRVTMNSAEWHQDNASCKFKISAWNNWLSVLWDVLHIGKEPTPQPSSSYLKSVRIAFQRTERIHSWVILAARDDVVNLSTRTRASSTSTIEFLYSIVRMQKMYAASSCPLSAAYSICWSPSALEPNS
jgi:hypothetical protein